MHYKFLLPIGIVIFITNILATLFGYMTINLGVLSANGPMLVAIIPFCLSFFFLDIFTNQYGLTLSKRLIYIIMCGRVFIAVSIFVILRMNFFEDKHFVIYLYAVYSGLCSGVIASFIAFNINCYIFSKSYSSFNAKFLWLRCIIASSIGELIYSAISNVLFLYNRESFSSIFLITIHNYGFKIFFEILSLPFTYAIVALLNTYETPYQIKLHNIEA